MHDLIVKMLVFLVDDKAEIFLILGCEDTFVGPVDQDLRFVILRVILWGILELILTVAHLKRVMLIIYVYANNFVYVY